MQREILAKSYEPKEVENKWYQYWEDNNLFRAESKSERKPFSSYRNRVTESTKV